MRDLFEESMNELLVVDIRKSLAAGMKALDYPFEHFGVRLIAFLGIL